jgi:subtilase family serine protease
MRFSRIVIAALVYLGSIGGPAMLAAGPLVGKAVLQGPAPSGEQVEFDVFLRLRNTQELDALLSNLQNPESPQYHKWLKPSDFHSRFGADPASLQAVAKELNTFGLTPQMLSPQQVHVTGTVAAVQRALQTQLQMATFHNGKKTMVAVGGMSMPPAMTSNNAVLVGLDGFIRIHSNLVKQAVIPENRTSNVGPYWFDDLKEAYKYPSFKALTGKGANIGVLIATGFNPSDMDLYFGHEGLKTPDISEVDVNGGAPFDPNLSDETELDLQQSGGMAPNAHLTLYNVPDLSDASLLAGLSTIVESNTVDVVNMSFGGPEITNTAAYNNGVDMTAILQVFDDLFKQGNAQGITFVAASGDSGALGAPAVACLEANAQPGCGSFVISASWPATDPHVTAVGGTNLVTTMSSTSLESKYISEAAFGDPLAEDIFFGTPASGGFWGSGGGESIFFKKPIYQDLVDTGSNVRTIPDLALHMGGCPLGAVLPCGPDRSSVILVLAGQQIEVIGTSASSPDFVGLLALKIEQLGTRLGNENYDIYTLAALQQLGFPLNAFNTDISGFNGVFSTHKGYNLVLGNGTVNGVDYLLAPGLPTAGTPQTPSNP